MRLQPNRPHDWSETHTARLPIARPESPESVEVATRNSQAFESDRMARHSVE